MTGQVVGRYTCLGLLEPIIGIITSDFQKPQTIKPAPRISFPIFYAVAVFQPNTGNQNSPLIMSSLTGGKEETRFRDWNLNLQKKEVNFLLNFYHFTFYLLRGLKVLTAKKIVFHLWQVFWMKPTLNWHYLSNIPDSDHQGKLGNFAWSRDFLSFRSHSGKFPHLHLNSFSSVSCQFMHIHIFSQYKSVKLAQLGKS